VPPDARHDHDLSACSAHGQNASLLGRRCAAGQSGRRRGQSGMILLRVLGRRWGARKAAVQVQAAGQPDVRTSDGGGKGLHAMGQRDADALRGEALGYVTFRSLFPRGVCSTCPAPSGACTAGSQRDVLRTHRHQGRRSAHFTPTTAGESCSHELLMYLPPRMDTRHAQGMHQVVPA
jgi:hypothetical protein